MPELPDVEVYVSGLRTRLLGTALQHVQVLSPHILRTVEPDVQSAVNRRVQNISRCGKRIIMGFDGDLHHVLHLMIAGRFRWQAAIPNRPPKIAALAYEFEQGCLLVTEAGSKKRATLHVVSGKAALARLHTPGVEILDTDRETFAQTLISENHTLKRALTDPRLFSGIGNAYSDEILHAAQLSPIKWTSKLTIDEINRLFIAAQQTLRHWLDVLHAQFNDTFPRPGDITAFRDDFAAHGRYQKPCPVCNTAIQRIRYASNETNYCPRCQTDGKILADRSLSRLLKGDWPRTIEELESR